MSDNKPGWTHLDEEGKTRMVGVGDKPKTHRVAIAASVLVMQASTLVAIREGHVAKGAVLGTARIAGIMAAKKTAELIPLCHPIEIVRIEVDFHFLSATELECTAEVHAVDRTGVEMEAMTAVSVAALTIYDMCKALDRGMEISRSGLKFKSGGRSGEFRR